MLEGENGNLLDLTAGIVAVYAQNNKLSGGDLTELIEAVHTALNGLGKNLLEEQVPAAQAAVSVRKSLADKSNIISMIDGKPYKMLTRHLKQHGHTPDSYRAAYGLNASYPMVAPAYSEQRRSLALASGLGRKPTT